MWAPCEMLMFRLALTPFGAGREMTVWVESLKSVNVTSSFIWLSVERGESSRM